MAREDWARFERAFARLSAEQQEIVSLSRLAGFSRRQVGECTGRTEESCRQELHRALVRIARHLERTDGA